MLAKDLKIILAALCGVLLFSLYFFFAQEHVPDSLPAVEQADGTLAAEPQSLPTTQTVNTTVTSEKEAVGTMASDKKVEQKPEVVPSQNSAPAKSFYNPFSFFAFEQKPSCPEKLFFDLPIDISKATSALYPGQVRSGEYKAHGGFRFDGSKPGEIPVTAPIDAPVIAGARYPVNGETQYTFDFEHPCGVRYRLGHLLTLTPKFQQIAERFPLPKTSDSRTTEVYPPVAVAKGEVIATAVGLEGTGEGGTGHANTFVDWGVYDYRQKNEASKDPSWAAAHPYETYQYAVCLFDWVSPEHRAEILALPAADITSGKQSDYCKS